MGFTYEACFCPNANIQAIPKNQWKRLGQGIHRQLFFGFGGRQDLNHSKQGIYKPNRFEATILYPGIRNPKFKSTSMLPAVAVSAFYFP